MEDVAAINYSGLDSWTFGIHDQNVLSVLSGFLKGCLVCLIGSTIAIGEGEWSISKKTNQDMSQVECVTRIRHDSQDSST